MYPIAWFPMVDPNETYSLDYIKTNKGTDIIYRDNVSFNGTENTKQFFGWCPKFTSGTVFSFNISSALGERIQKGFGITATLYLREPCTTKGQLFKFYNTNDSIEIGYRNGFYVRRNNGSEIEIGDVVTTTVTYGFAIVFTGIELCVYINKECVYTTSCYYPSTNLSNSFIVGGGAYPFTIMNIKIYDTELSMKQLLEDYAILYGHYKFDGSSSDDTSYNMEYDCSGIGVDVTAANNFSLSSTYSPIRQYSAVTNNGGFTIPVGSQFYVCAWVNVMTMMTDIFTVKMSGQEIISISRNGNNLEIFMNDDCIPPAEASLLIPYSTSEWIFVELTLYWSALAIRSFKVRISTNRSPVTTECIFNNNNIGDMTIEVGTGMAISDLRAYINPPTDQELSYLVNRNVHIDDKGTLYATELQDLSHLSTFGFGDRGQIMAPEFTDTKDLGELGVMEYDYLNGVMNLNSFKEV